VLFADLVGFTAFSDRRGEEAAYSLMQRICELMTDAIHAQAGTVKSFTGDGVMAQFGVPTAQEDAPLRACRAALDIQQRIGSEAAAIEVTFGLRPQVRIGINTGPLIVGEIKSGESSGVTAIGDTVNLAARLLALAEPSAVVLSETTHLLVRGLVDINPAGEHEVKGKAKKQKIYRLDAIRHSAARFDRSISVGLTAYFGRSRELEALEQDLEAALHGLRVTDIVGEPGIGKSRLVHEFRKRIDDRRALVLLGSCTPDGHQTPFLLFIDIVRRSFRVSKSEPESEITHKLDRELTLLGLASEQNLGLLLNLLGLKAPEGALTDLDGALVGLRTRDLLLRLLQECCRLTPVAMVLEDLHWIDNASEELIGSVIALQTELPLLIVETHRPGYRAPWSDQPRVRTLRLEPLTATDTSRIVCARLGVNDLPESLALLVTDKAEGNPLFAEEIVSYLVERGVVRHTGKGIRYDEQTVAATLPASIQSLLSARVDQLSQEDRYLLQAASVIGRRFSRDLLGVLTRSDDIDGHLAAIERLDLIRSDARSETYAFKHALVRDALYDRLLSAQREALHLKVANEIERGSANRFLEVTEVLAYHYGCTSEADKAFEYLSLAGRKSLAIYSLQEAEQYCRKALDLIDAQPGCAGKQAVAEVIALLLEVLYLNGNNPAVAREAERHMPRLEAMPDSPHLAVALGFYALTLGNKCEFRAGEAAAMRALDIAERIGDAKAEGYALVGLLFCATVLSRYPQAGSRSPGRTATREQREDRKQLSAKLGPLVHRLGLPASWIDESVARLGCETGYFGS
jgi:class 3 adenylate cyclase